MRTIPVPKPRAEDWTDALLTSGSESLLGAVRNYLGPVKTPYDKRDLSRRLEAFLRRPETQEAILELLDPLDARILGSCLLLGPVPEQVVKDLFAGEIPLFELGVRMANLLDRLLLFRWPLGSRRLIAVNPLLEPPLRSRILDARLLFGLEAPSPKEGGCACDTQAAVGFFSFLFHAPLSLRKGGGLTKRAAERAALLFPRLAAADGDRLGALARAFAAAGAIGGEGDEKEANRAAFSRLLADWGEDLVYFLAASLAANPTRSVQGASSLAGGIAGIASGGEAQVEQGELFAGSPADSSSARARLLAQALSAAPIGFVFSRAGLARWLRIASRRVSLFLESAPAIEAMELLGLLVRVPRGGSKETEGAEPGLGGTGRGEAGIGEAGLAVAVERVEGSERVRDQEAGASRLIGEGARFEAPAKRRVLVAEGAHALHLLPEASLEERLLVGTLARPLSLEKVWSFELERETARRAFAAGLGAASIKASLEAMAGEALPQSLAFSLSAWEEEYRSLRLYRGLFLVADERLRAVVERSSALGSLVAERLGPGLYFLATGDPEAAAEAIARAGLEAPPLTAPSGSAAARAQAAQATAYPQPAAWLPELAPGAAAEADPAADADPAAPRRAAATTVEADPVTSRPAAAPRNAAAGLHGVVEELAREADFRREPARIGSFDPAPRIEALRAAIESAQRGVEEKREFTERLERRLVLTPRQIEEADPRVERLEAGGLDYLGKVRVVERALRGSGDRLEVLYRLPGAEPVRALLRPVRLDKGEKGLVLEAEDLGSGGPARVPLGAVSTVRRLRASLFGDDT